MAELEVDWSSIETGAWVEDLDFVEEVVVEEMVMKVVDFDLEVVEFVEKMEEIDKIEKISHKDFAYLVPMIDMDFEVGAKVVAKDSNLAGVKNS